MAIDFDFNVKKSGNKYIFIAREYGVALCANDAVSGLKELEDRVENVANQFREAGVEPIAAHSNPAESFSSRPQGTESSGIWHDYFLFASKLAIILFFVAGFLLFEAALLERYLGPSSTFGNAIIHPGQFVVKLANEADSISPARISEWQLAVRKLVTKFAPIFDEIKSPTKANQLPAQTDQKVGQPVNR
jgi:hypothetical protein